MKVTDKKKSERDEEALTKAKATIDKALDTVKDDIEAGLSDDVMAAMALVQAKKPAAYMDYRAKFKKANKEIRFNLLDGMVKQAAGSESSGEFGFTEALIELATGAGTLFLGDDDEPYIEIEFDDHREVWALASRGFKDWISAKFYEEYSRGVKSAQLSDALVTLSGKAANEGETHKVHLRVAQHPQGGYLLDICDDKWRVIHVSDTGWQILNRSPVKFRRSKGAKPLPITEDTTGTLDDLLAVINIKKEDAPLIVAVLLEYLRPETAYPITEVRGEQGSAKSTTTANLRSLIDPHNDLLRARPKTVEDVYVGARQNHIVCYNNLSRLSGDMQDALCTLSTGGGYASRTLYTNSEESVFDAKSAVIMNGIVPLATQADTLDRVLGIDCPQLLDDERISDAAMAAMFEEHAPKALAFLLDTFCKALRFLPSVEIKKPPRMMDFALLGEATNEALGNDPGAFTERYKDSLKQAATQSIDGAPVIEALVKLLELQGSYDGTIGGLLDDIEACGEYRRDSAWPKSAKGFGDALRRATPPLRLMGWAVTHAGSRRVGVPVQIKKLFSSDIKTLPKTPSQSSQRSPSGQILNNSDSGREHCERRELVSGQKNKNEEKKILNGECPPSAETGTEAVL